MKHIVKNKQNNSKNCLVCGIDNHFGLKTRFYENEQNEVIALFVPGNSHQSYPGVTHGGISAAVLDETIGRAIMSHYDHQIWGVTVDLKIRYRKPIPIGVELKAIGRITKEKGRFFEGTGEIYLPNGEVAVSCSGKYIKRSIGDIATDAFSEEEWFSVEDKEAVTEIVLP